MRLVIILCVLLSPVTLLAQRDSVRSNYVGAAYFSESGFNPGFTFTYERKLLSTQQFQLLLDGKAGAYFHAGNHTGIFLMVQSGQRYRISKKFHFEHYLGIGYLHSFLNGGDAYFVNASGQVQKASDWGNPHFMPSISFGFSYHLENAPCPSILFLRPMIFWQIPFNNVALVQYGLEAGAMIKIK